MLIMYQTQCGFHGDWIVLWKDHDGGNEAVYPTECEWLVPGTISYDEAARDNK